MSAKSFPERIAEKVLECALALDDRTSPEDQPDMLLVTAAELHDFVQLAFERAAFPLEASRLQSGELERLRRIESAARTYIRARDENGDQGLAWTELNAAVYGAALDEPAALGSKDPTIPARTVEEAQWTKEGDPAWFAELSAPNRALARAALSAEYCRGRDHQARAAEEQRNPSGFPPRAKKESKIKRASSAEVLKYALAHGCSTYEARERLEGGSQS